MPLLPLTSTVKRQIMRMCLVWTQPTLHHHRLTFNQPSNHLHNMCYLLQFHGNDRQTPKTEEIHSRTGHSPKSDTRCGHVAMLTPDTQTLRVTVPIQHGIMSFQILPKSGPKHCQKAARIILKRWMRINLQHTKNIVDKDHFKRTE